MVDLNAIVKLVPYILYVIDFLVLSTSIVIKKKLPDSILETDSLMDECRNGNEGKLPSTSNVVFRSGYVSTGNMIAELICSCLKIFVICYHDLVCQKNINSVNS